MDQERKIKIKSVIILRQKTLSFKNLPGLLYSFPTEDLTFSRADRLNIL